MTPQSTRASRSLNRAPHRLELDFIDSDEPDCLGLTTDGSPTQTIEVATVHLHIVKGSIEDKPGVYQLEGMLEVVELVGDGNTGGDMEVLAREHRLTALVYYYQARCWP